MKHLSKLIMASLLLPLLLLNSCEDSFLGCIHGNGRIATENRYTGDFENIVSYGSFEVDVFLGTETGVSIEADENLIPYITTNIQGNTLILDTRNNRCISSQDGIRIYVDATHIERLKLSGSGIINCDDIESDQLDIEVPGSGEIRCNNIKIGHLRASLPGSGIIELSGTANTSDYTISGSGIIRAIHLLSQTCYASIPGSGVVYTAVEDKLDVTISGSGNLYYSGNPVITSTITGSGNIRIYK